MENRRSIRFNVNVFSNGILLAVLLCAIGFSKGSPMLQWGASGAVAVLALAGAFFWPQKQKPAPEPAKG